MILFLEMGRKTRNFLKNLGKIIDATDKAVKEKRAKTAQKHTVIKAISKPKVIEQTPTGMANSTKSSPYIPPQKKITKSQL